MIKKSIFSLLIAFVCAASVDGQNKFVPEWNVGVGFGPTFTSVDFQNGRGNSVPTKSMQQFHGGLAIRYITEKKLGLIGE